MKAAQITKYSKNITAIHTLGFEQIDILSLSMGGMIAQELITIEPQLVRKLILAGTGPRGGEGIKDVTKITNIDMVRAIITLKDIKTYVFFTRTENGKQKAKEFLTFKTTTNLLKRYWNF